MHKLAVKAVVEHCRKRAADGDCPARAPLPVEALEDAILELAREPPPFKLLTNQDRLRREIASDPDEEPQAGESHFEQANAELSGGGTPSA